MAISALFLPLLLLSSSVSSAAVGTPSAYDYTSKPTQSQYGTATSSSYAALSSSGYIAFSSPAAAATSAAAPPPPLYAPITPENMDWSNSPLSQSSTNGGCSLGTFNASTFAPFMGSGTTYPWGNRTVNLTNPYQDAPVTGVVRKYTFEISRKVLAPDGVETEMLLVNGQFPGPTIEANWGDEIEVTVVNNIQAPAEGTSLHWHGFLQKGTPYEDGVPGVTQCPIAPGTTFTYRFAASLYGSSWYHGHYSSQYAGGLVGPIVIHGPTSEPYDIDLGPVFITDHYHTSYLTLIEGAVGKTIQGAQVFSDNNLINGKGQFDCSLITDGTPCTPGAGYSKFQFETGKTYLLRLINAGAEGLQKFSIDEHTMMVVAYDFVPIQPYQTDVVTLGIGQRADVLVTATGTAGESFFMRSTITNCSLPHQPNAYAVIYYEGTDGESKPTSQPWPVDISNTTCGNDPLEKTIPLYPMAPPRPDNEATIDVSVALNASGNIEWYINNSSFRADYNAPLLALAEANAATTYDAESNVYNFGSAKSIRLVITNTSPLSHPMHIHGHNMYVLADGIGEWDGSIVNPYNPTRRDVQMLQAPGPAGPGFIVIQIDLDNPGVWPFHCHIAWHASGGFFMNILDHPDQIPTLIKPPTEVTDLCTSWNAFTSSTTVDDIDSGV